MPMKILLNRTGLWILAAVALLGAATAYAASIDARPHKNYGRVNFTFDIPVKLKTSADGTTAVLMFDSPLDQSPEAIRNALPDYVTGTSMSADKRNLILTLNKPYRIRQFISGNTVGIDLIDDDSKQTTLAKAESVAESKPNEPAAVKQEAKPEPARQTEKPAPTKPQPETKTAAAQPQKTQSTEPTLSTKPSKEVTQASPGAGTSEAMLSTKSPTAEKPSTKSEKPAPVVPEKPTTDPMLSTKVAEKPAVQLPEASAAKTPEPMTTTKAPEPKTEPTKPAPAAEHTTTTEAKADPSALSTKKSEAATQTPNEPVKTDPASATPAAKAEPAASGPFVVSARTTNSETILNFPWADRTAAAVFERGRDIWIVFSQAKDVNAALLRTIVPKQVATVTQYAMPGYTVLRLATDGSLRASASQAKGGYGWNVALSTSAIKPQLDVSFSADALDKQMRMILGVFDVAEPLKFYDPIIGDQLIVIPSYENGRGVSNERNYPEFSVLASNQGVTIVSRREDLTTTQSRLGLIVSTKNGLAVSENLPLLSGNAPVAGASATSGVMIPYDQWYVPPDAYFDTLFARLKNIAFATKATKAESMMELVKLYLAKGWGAEALGMLNLIKTQFPDYYKSNNLALLSAASNVMMNHIGDAAKDLEAPELLELEEATLWREVVSLYTPTASTVQTIQKEVEQGANPANDSAANTPGAAPAAPSVPPVAIKPIFHYLKYNKPFIRFYPPNIRQRLSVLAGDAYIADGQEEKALAVYDALMRDGILEPVKNDAEFALGTVAAKKEETDQALEIFDRLGKQKEDRRTAARARYAAAMLRLKKGLLPAETVTEILESARMNWRGDALEREILMSLIDLYKELKAYDDVLRSQKAILDAFPNDPETLRIAGDMGDLFARIFLEDLGDDMPPLKALSLFYEFRELTPIGERGDQIIQKLADRLAAIDLLDRATQLLEHQIKFRISGEQRSQVGARLALLHLLNQHPKEALSVLEITNYGGNRSELQTQRQQLTAQSLLKLGKPEEALGVLYNDSTKTGALLRLDILWAMQDWPNVVNRAEDILAGRPSLTEPLTTQETEVLLKLALGYSFEGDYVQLRYLKDYYSPLVPNTAYKQIFEFITNDTNPLDPDDFALLAQQISNTETFLGTFKAKIAAGKLSDTVK